MGEESEKDERVLSCDGINNKEDNPSLGHPKIYMKVSSGEERPCPYCGKLLR